MTDMMRRNVKMKAAVWYARGDVRVVDVPNPEVKSHHVKIKVKWCGICGSDLHEYIGGPLSIPVESPHPLTGQVAPVIMGHELSGEVVEVGEGVSKLKIGDRVVTEATVCCGECPACRSGHHNLCEKLGIHGLCGSGGGFAEYTVFHEDFTHRIPDTLDYERAALVEPIAVGFHSLIVGKFKPGMTAVVLGAGPIGIGVIESLKASGAKKIIAVVRKSVRQEHALQSGADYLIDPTDTDVADEIRKINNGECADIAFETYGVDLGIKLGLASIHFAGTLVVISLWERPPEVNMMDIVLTEKSIIGSLIYNGNDFDTVVQMLADGRIKAKGYITKRILLDDFVPEGLETLAGPEKKKHVKIIVTPDRSLL
jgi:(R,R)-butanediol dehydrogenase/meso-butanediol dehydrogenase/diacetyl reductase